MFNFYFWLGRLTVLSLIELGSKKGDVMAIKIYSLHQGSKDSEAINQKWSISQITF